MSPKLVGRRMVSAFFKLPTAARRSLIVAWDSFSWIVACFLFLLVRYDLQLSTIQWQLVSIYLVSAVLAQGLIGLITQVYLGRNRVGSFDDATWIGLIVVLTGMPLGLILNTITPNFPRGVALILPPLALVFMAFGRWLFRVVWATRHASGEGVAPTLVYGAGDAGHQVARLIDMTAEPHHRLVGFIDDDPAKRWLRVQGHRVLGTGRQLAEKAAEAGATNVIFAISESGPALLKEVADICDANGLKLQVLPPVKDMIGGRVSLSALRDFNVADLLGRRPIETDLEAISDYVKGKVVLITGAGGSIGSELARQVHRLRPSKLVLLDRDESALHGVQLSLYGVGLLDSDDIALCSIRDYDALKAIFEHHRPDVVFHAAALKHLPLLEQYPGEGWKTNVLGSLNVLRCAHETGVSRVVNVSTDKAADPTSVLGITKHLAEQLTAWYAKQYDLPYVSVRFGNVLGSRGSVFHTFRSQIERGGPLTVTHPDVTRYFMLIPEACELVMQAGAIGDPGDVLVLDMGDPIKIVDVAQRLIAESGKDIEIEFTGLRHGEKMHEVLFSDVENGARSAHPMISHVPVTPVDPSELAAPVFGEEIGVASGSVPARTESEDDLKETW